MRKTFKTIFQFSFFQVYEQFRINTRLKKTLGKQKIITENYLKNQSLTKLQLGTGSNFLPGWLNTDLNETEEAIFLDAGKPFPFSDNSFNYIFSEHLFEHLTPIQQINLLNESLRVLKPNGVLRIATPTLEFLWNIYSNPTSTQNSKYIKWAINNLPQLKPIAENIDNPQDHYTYVINNFFKAWGHQMIHNFASLKNMSLQSGFSEVKSEEIGKSSHPSLQNLEKHGTIIPEDINYLETMVMELTKK